MMANLILPITFVFCVLAAMTYALAVWSMVQ
jgi:hypothetical protein